MPPKPKTPPDPMTPDYTPPLPEGAPPDFFRLWTVNDVGRSIRRHPQTIYRMVDAGEIKAIRVGKGRGSVRFRKEDIEEYINAHMID